MEIEQRNRVHRAKQAGNKASRQARQKKKKALGSASDEKRHNPKAFTFSGGVVSVQRRVQHSLDKAAKKERKHVVDKTPSVAPPYTVVVQGPPQVGKSLLIRCLARHYARCTVGAVRGPVTLVASKQRRLTFLECPNAASGMLDAAKVADIALILIDAQYGFEMETFEFINMLQTHGMPRVIGVLTHLDALPDRKVLKRRKKELKARFWSELYDGAKLFFLSGLRNGRYHNRDILNLARFVSVQKVRPLQWRAAHPYVLALKTDYRKGPLDALATGQQQQQEEQPEEQQRVCVVYGYVRGAVLRAGHVFHIPGAGDFPIAFITKCEDPCPAPTAEEEPEPSAPTDPQDPGEATDKSAKRKKRSRAARALKEKQRCIYAPDCDIGGMRLDDDAMYIHLPDTKVGFTPKAQLIRKNAEKRKTDGGDKSESLSSSGSESEGSDDVEAQSGFGGSSDVSSPSSSSESDSDEVEEDERDVGPAIKMVRKLQGAEQQLSRQLHAQKLHLLDSSTRAIDADAPPPRRAVDADAPESSEHLFYADDADDDDDEKEEGRLAGAKRDTDSDSLNSSEAAGDRVLELMHGLTAAQQSLAVLVYGHPGAGGDTVGSFLKPKKNRRLCQDGKLSLFEDSDGSTSGSDGDGDTSDPAKGKGQGRSLFGNLPLVPSFSGLSPDFDFGDAPKEEAAAIYRVAGIDPEDPSSVDAFWSSQRIAAIKRRFFITGGWQALEEAKAEAFKQKPVDEALNDEEEKKKKEEQEQKALAAAQKTFQGSEESMGGFAIGTYVKICIPNLPKEWLESLDPSHPVVLGGLNAGELQCTFMQLRVRKHRWSPRILKSSDPLLFSVGWRRFQALPIYAMEDRGETRVKYLKYTPEHLHCLAYIYAPALPPSTPLLAIRDTRAIASYRIAASGITLQMTPEPKIEKKLKLIGEAKRIFKNTAFIKGMFNSDLEVNRCIGAKIQTASGIRGQIKKAVGTDGTFRASFEDKILMSDLVICKAWIKVSPKPFFNPMLDVASWRRLRTQAEIRNAKQLPLPYKDSNLLPYGGPPRVQRKFNPIRIPKQLAMKLPFHSKPKLQAPTSRLKNLKGKKLQDERDLQKPLVSAYDKRVAALLQRLQTIRNAREQQRRVKQQKKLNAKQKLSAKAEGERLQKQQQIRKKRYVKKGKVETGMRKKLKLDGNEKD